MMRHGADSTRSALRHAGSALLTALVFLLVLTLLGTFGMQQSRLENRMAGNAQFQILALHNAEYVLAAAEADIEAQTGNPFLPDRPGDHYYPQEMVDFDTGMPGVQQPSDRVWTFVSAQLSLPDINGDGTGRYIIQDAGLEHTFDTPIASRHAPVALIGSTVQAFLVTARSQTSSGAQRTVQSVYVRTPLPITDDRADADQHTAQAAFAAANRSIGRRSWIDLRD